MRFYDLAKRYHPDTAAGKSLQNQEKFKRITEAYEVLSNVETNRSPARSLAQNAVE